MDELAQAIETGSYADLLQAIGRLNDRQRKSAVTWLVGQWKDHRAVPHPRDATESMARWMRLLVGLTAAAEEPKKALAIPVRYGYWESPKAAPSGRHVGPVSVEAVAALAQAAIGHGAAWCARYLELTLGARKPKDVLLEVVQLMARAHQLPLTATPVAPELWAADFASLMLTLPPGSVPPRAHTVRAFDLQRRDAGFTVTGREVTVSTAAEALRAGLDTEPMLLSLFDHRDAVIRLTGNYSSQQGMDAVADVVAELVGDGTVDASRLALQAIAALSRGDSVGCQRLQTRLLKVAKPDAALVRDQARVLASLLASGSVTTAALALELLHAADTPAPLPDDLFAEACQIAFARKEKGLHEAQLAWTRDRLGRPSTKASAAAGLCAALLCPEHGIQQQAATALQSAWPTLEAPVRAALLASIEASQGVLDDALFRPLWSACTGGAAAPAAGKPPRVEPQRTGLPRVPYEPVPDPARLPADVLQAIQTYHLDRDPLASERLVGAAQEALRSGRVELARAIGRHLQPQLPFGTSFGQKEGVRHEMSHVAVARRDELLRCLEEGRPRAFVSAPSWAHGAIAGADLADRLAALAQAGEPALPVDLLVALLRTEPCDAQTLARLRAIGSADAQAAADFLAEGGAAQLTTRWQVIEGGDSAPSWRPRFGPANWVLQGERSVCVALGRVARPPTIEGAPLDWAAGFEAGAGPYVSEFDMAPDWITTMLPTNAEALAALHLYGFRRAGLDDDTDGGKAVGIRLPLFTAAHGPAGPAMHLAVLFTMSANVAPVRLAGSDGMVALLQQGRWQEPLAAELVAECLRCGSLKAGRLASSLEPVLQAGEAAAVWSLARAAIAAALGLQPVPAAAADLMALGTLAIAEAGTPASVDGLDAFVAAIRGKPNKLQAQALRLHAAQAGPR